MTSLPCFSKASYQSVYLVSSYPIRIVDFDPWIGIPSVFQFQNTLIILINQDGETQHPPQPQAWSQSKVLLASCSCSSYNPKSDILSRCSNSWFFVKKGLISSIYFPVENFELVEEFSCDNLFDFFLCSKILLVRKIPKVILGLVYLYNQTLIST